MDGPKLPDFEIDGPNLQNSENNGTNIGLSHDQIALFKTFHDTTKFVQGRLSTSSPSG